MVAEKTDRREGSKDSHKLETALSEGEFACILNISLVGLNFKNIIRAGEELTAVNCSMLKAQLQKRQPKKNQGRNALYSRL